LPDGTEIRTKQKRRRPQKQPSEKSGLIRRKTGTFRKKKDAW
jgi:hypothetical protein